MGRRKFMTLLMSLTTAGSLAFPTAVIAGDELQNTEIKIESEGEQVQNLNQVQDLNQVQGPDNTQEQTEGSDQVKDQIRETERDQNPDQVQETSAPAYENGDAGQSHEPEVKVTVNGDTADYESIAEAVAAVNETDADAYIEVQKDIELTSGMEFKGNGTVTIAGREKYTIKKTGYTGSAVSGKTVVLNNIIIDGNNEKGGGVRLAEGGSLTLDNADIVNNRLVKEGKNGGAVYVPGGEVTVKNGSLIKGNVIAGSGAAVFAKTVTVEDSNITDNVAGEGNTLKNSVYGGAVYAEDITITTTGDDKETNITGNIAKGGRGGAIATDSDNANLVIEGNTLIADNSTEEDAQASYTAGGAIFIKNGNATVKGDAQIIRNSAKGEKGFGGAIAVGKGAKGELNLEGEILITENHADAQGGGIRLNDGSSEVNVKDGVQITGNTSALGKNIYIEGGDKRSERLRMSGSLTSEAIIGVRVADDGPQEGVVFGKTDASFTGEEAILSDRNDKFTGKKDDKGNLYWHSDTSLKVTYLDADTGKEEALKVEKGEKINIEPSGGKYNGVTGNSVLTVTEEKKITGAEADERAFEGWRVEKKEGYSYVLTAVFTSRLVVYGDKPSMSVEGDAVIGTLGDAHLLSFEEQEEARQQAEELREKGFLVSEDISLSADDDADVNQEASGEKTDNNTDNPFTQAEELINNTQAGEDTANEEKVRVALIDTGVNDEAVERYSVIGEDVSDDSGHGTKMLSFIRQEAPGVEVISIKALGKDGKGTIAGIYAAVELALAKDVKLINLSLSARSTQENEILRSIIERASKQGVTVVVSAGNDGKDVSGYTPANIESAVTIGALDENKERRAASNYGDTVDYWVQAKNTSEATARFSGMCALYGGVDAAVEKQLESRIFTMKPGAEQAEISEGDGESSDGEFHSNEQQNTNTNATDPEEKKIIEFTKIWNDNKNADLTRPRALYVTLYQDGKAYRTVRVTGEQDADKWEYVFYDVPIYTDETNTTAHVYTVGEQELMYYDATDNVYNAGRVYDHINVTDNSEQDISDISGVVVPKDSTIDNIEKYLPQNATIGLDQSKLRLDGDNVEFNTFGNDEYKIETLFEAGFAQNENGRINVILDRTDNPIESSDTPILLEGDQFSIRYKDAAYTENGRADVITTISDIEIYNPTGRNISKMRVINDESSNNVEGFIFGDDNNDITSNLGAGKAQSITTRIVESGTNNPIQGYMLVHFLDLDQGDSCRKNGNYAEGVTVISGAVSPAYLPATSKILATGVERQEDKENANGVRFFGPAINSNEDGTLDTGFVTLMETSGFTVRHSSSVLREGHVVGSGTLSEKKVNIDTATITNTISPDIDPRANDRLIVSFIKTWDDKNNSGGTRPDSIPVTLYRNGEAYRTVNVTGYANADTWEFHFEDLPRYTDNTYTTEYEYSVKEGEVVGYQRSNGGEATYSKKDLIPYFNATDNGIFDNCDTLGVVMVKGTSSGVSHARYLPRGNVFLDRSKLSSSDIDPKITMNGVTRGEYSYKKEPSGINRYHPENPVPENVYIRDAAITWNSKGNTIPAHTEMDIPGTVTALYENAAQTVNGYADVQITYKKIHVNNPSPYSIKEIQIGDGSRFAPAFYSDDLPWDYAMYSSDEDHNAMQDFNPGIEMEVEIKVLEHGTAIPVDGKALLYVEDIDAPDYTVSNNSTELIIASDYSESLKVVNGALTPLIMQGNAYWVNNFGRKGIQGSSSDGTGNGIRIAGLGQTNHEGFRSGFATLVDTKSTILNYTGSFHFSNEDMKIKPYLPFIGEEVFGADRSFITNSYIPNYVSEKGNTLTLRFTKTWDDANNVAGERPASIPVTLYRDGQPYRTVDVTGDPKADTWVYDFVDLPLYTDDTKTTEYQYRVNEGEIENYSVSQIDSDGYGQYIVRNRFPYDYVSDNALEDTNDVVGIISPKNRRLYGVQNDDSVFRNFPEKHDVSIDKDKLMSVNADPKITTSGVSRGSYSFKVQGYGLDRYNPTNPKEKDTVERLNLSWSAGGNPIPAGADMDIPGTVTTVYENAAYTKNGYGDVQLTYKNIHVYNPSPYSIKEIHLGDGADFNPTFFSDDLPWDYAHYSSEGTDNAMSDFNPGIRMEVEIKVFEHGTKIPIDGRALLTVKDIDEPDYTKTKNGLPHQYSTDYRESLQIVNGALTPLYVESVGFFSKKGIFGDNIRGESVDGTGSGLTLLATRMRNSDTSFYQGYLSVFDTKGTTLKYTGSTRFSNDDLHTTSYTQYIQTSNSSGLQNIDYTYLTNTYIPEYARTQNFETRTVEKRWNDQNNARGYRPESIDIILYRDGEVYRRATMTGDANAATWTYQFVDLPTYKDGTKEKSVYTVDEENVKNYIKEGNISLANQYTLNREYAHVTDNGTKDESEIFGVVIPKGTSATNIKNRSVPMANTSLREGFGDEVEGLQISANGVYYGKYEVNEVPRGQDVYNPNTPIPEPTFTTKDLQWKATGTPIAAGSERDIPGTVTLLYENAAYTSEGLADVQITYSKVHVKNTSPYSINKIDFGNGEDIRLTFYSDDLPEDYGKGENSEYKDFNPGVTFEREVKILKHGTTNPVEGSVLLSVADLDNRDRTVTKLGMDTSLGYGGEYAEQVGVVSGALSPMYIPGHTFQTEENGIQGESKDGTANGLRAVAVVSYDNASLACGFLTLVDASGYTIRYAGSSDFSTEYKDNHCFVDFVSEQNVRQASSILNNILKPNYEEEGRLTEILFTKTWDDNNNEEGLRPESIDVILYQDGEIYRRATVTGDANADTWEYNFTSIPINKTGTQDEQHIYTIKEEDVSYYTPSDNGVADVNLGRNGFYTRIEDNDSDDLSDLPGVIIPDGTNESEVENKESILGYVPDGDVYFERDILGGRQGDGPQITATNVNHGKFNKGEYLSSEGSGYPNIVYWESTDDPIPAGAEMDISGEVTLLYEMAAYTPGGYADVQLTYKNIHVINPSNYSISRIYFGDGEKMTITFESDELSGDQNSNWRFSPGYKLDIEVKVLEHGTTNPVEGAVLLGFKDMDQKDQTVGRLGYTSAQYGMEYSEQIGVVSGALSPMYMPATTYQTLENGIQGESVDGNANGLTVVGVNSDVDTYRSGFIALMDASGYTIRYAGSNRFSNEVTRIPRRSYIAGYTERVSGSSALTNTVAPPVPTGLGVGKADVAGRMIPIIIAACGGAGAFIFFEMRRRKRRRNAERKEA